MTDYDSLAAGYIRAWNERDPAARRAAVGDLWAAGGRYTDPLADVAGAEAIDAVISAAQEQFPDFVFRLTGTVDGHHSQCRFSWELGPTGAPAPVAGSDVAVIGADGRLEAVLGFLDRVPG
jgi:hypothetical protein